MTEPRKIPSLDIKLSGASTYSEWVVSIETYLDFIPVERTEEYRVWDIVMGIYIQPATEFYALLDSLTTSLTFDDRKIAVNEHVTNYERTWNTFVGIISRADLTNDDGFGKGLKEFSKSDKAKAEFLLKSFPPYYSNTIENIRSKDNYGYGDVARKLKEYVPARQKSQRPRTQGTGSSDDPIVLKTTSDPRENDHDNGKRCDYCINFCKRSFYSSSSILLIYRYLCHYLTLF
jgi:hypothetical protein